MSDERDTKPREPGCECHLEEGDSPCPVHGVEGAELLSAGQRLPFVQTGMVVHHEDSPLCECMIVSEIWDSDDGMQATVLSRFGEPGVISCRDLRHAFRLARDFDQLLTYTGRWGRMPRGTVVPEAEVERDA